MSYFRTIIVCRLFFSSSFIAIPHAISVLGPVPVTIRDRLEMWVGQRLRGFVLKWSGWRARSGARGRWPPEPFHVWAISVILFFIVVIRPLQFADHALIEL